MTRDDCPETPQGQHLADLFRDHGDGLAGAVCGVLGQRADVQEILQEAFVKAFRALSDGFAPRHPVAWLFVITMNLAKDQRRRDRRRTPGRNIEDVNEMELQSKEPAPAAGLEQAEALAAARVAIHELRPQERDVFLLRTSAGLSFAEAATALQIPIGTAKTRMRAALMQLRRRLCAGGHGHVMPQPAPRPAPSPSPSPIPRIDIQQTRPIQQKGQRKTS